ncbi:topoisomerase IV [Sesbania bispinosa]|nr:topoisomerase IV [Sesbania bispinosa]
MALLVPSLMPSPVASHVTGFSDDNESVEDGVYRPSPYVSEGDEMDDSMVNLFGKKKKGFKTKTTPSKRKIGHQIMTRGKEYQFLIGGRNGKMFLVVGVWELQT